MSPQNARAESGAPLSTTAIAAIATGIGVIVLCLIALVILLIRAVRNHKQLLADLEERGVNMTRTRGEADDSVARPRAVLRRNTILPFNTKSGWDTLTSVDTLKSTEAPNAVGHYVPPKPTETVTRTSRLSWPFHARRVSGPKIPMNTMKGTRLSTVIEDPKPSALVPVLSNPHLNASRPSLIASSKHGSRPSSSQSLLRHHPAFRSPALETVLPPIEAGAASNPYFRSNANNRLLRARSFAAIPSGPALRPQMRARSTSLCSQASGAAPDVILPPLPLDIARIKSDARRRSQIRPVPSKQSMESVRSADSAILSSRLSPIITQATKKRAQKITKPRARGSTIGGARPFRDTLDLREKVLGSRQTANGFTPRTSLASLDSEDPYNEVKSMVSEESSSQSVGVVNRAHSITLNKVSSPVASPLQVRNNTTPKRKLKTQVSHEGSPERQYYGTAASRALTGSVRSPKRQHSQTSSRSSGGNPFQWDPTPFSSTGKPSALKGSPSARQGHRRKNSVRISLVPTFHGPPSDRSSPAPPATIKDDTVDGAATAKPASGLGIEVSSANGNPTPPTSATFSPDLKFSTTSLRASLTPTSPTLPLVNYDQSFVVFPTDHVLPELSAQESKRLSNGSIFSLSNFPATPSIIEPVDIDMNQPLTFPSTQTYEYGDDFNLPDTPFLSQQPFRPETPEENKSTSTNSLIDIDEYDPERPSMVFQTPPPNMSSRAWQSAFAPIPEESSAASQKALNVQQTRYDDSPAVSPKTMSPPRFDLEDRSAYNLPVYATTIPEEVLDTIDPSILSKDAFSTLNSSFSHGNGSITRSAHSSRSNLTIEIPESPGSAQLMSEPLLHVAFPSSPPRGPSMESPVLGHIFSEASSMYSSPSPSPTSSPIQLPSPVMPCSPRPSHAELPNQSLSINFAEMPKLAPSPRGPRGSPPKPLRTSIAALRRMNSDAADAKKEKAGRGERRYLRLGREDSVQLPGDESWLDEIEDDDNIELDEAEGRRLVGNVLDEWDEGCTVLDLDESTILSTKPITPDTEFNTFTSAGASKRSSSIWEDGEKFWSSPPTSSTGNPPGSPNKPKDRYQPLASSPLASPALSMPIPSTPPYKIGKKRDFQVAKDSTVQLSPTENHNRNYESKKRRESTVDSRRASASGNRYRKRSVLGTATPNVRIQITSPNGRVTMGTSGSLYDAQGFLRG
ncbi:hypothetical protein BKA63DRAFT_578748 [Paraphoma chrysanthemicola]|nr:hypothetical protein BKA63DRAFT_578748 [Paraphoma chrysanthemicola]